MKHPPLRFLFRYGYLGVLWFFTLPAFSAQILTVKENATGSANIASQAATRISVQNDRISVIRGVENAYTTNNDNAQGAVLIKPTDAYQKTPFYVFVSTEQGRNYVLLLTPQPIPAGMLILKPKTKAAAQAPSKNLSFTAAISKLLTHMAAGTATEDDTVTTIQHSKIFKINKALRMQLITRYENADFIGEIYRVINHFSQPITLYEQDFYQPQDCAIALQKMQLPAHDATLLYKVVKHG